MRIGLYHGYELTGSGSNEYNRYLAGSLRAAGHEVHIICREPKPEVIDYCAEAHAWSFEDDTVSHECLFTRDVDGARCVIHQLPHGRVRPVYLTDKQRKGNVKAFINLSEEERLEYHRLNEMILTRLLAAFPLDVVHANHVVYQPVAALPACRANNTPLIVFPHGSAIEYTVRPDKRYEDLAIEAMLGADGLVIGNHEVRDRILTIYPEHRDSLLAKTEIVGVGVDTALFKPVHKNERRASIEALKATAPGGGKTAAQVRELHDRMDANGVQATTEFRTSYDHGAPDDDIIEHLDRIPWDANILLFVGAFTAGKGLQSFITALPGVLATNPNTHAVIVGSGAYREVLEGLVYAIDSGNEALVDDLAAHGIDLDRNDLTGPWEDVVHYLSEPTNRKTVFENGQNLLDHIHFVGRLDHSRLNYLFPCADIAVFPSVVPEAYPLVLMESLSNGVLPVVSYFSGFADGVDELEPDLGSEMVERMRIPVDPGTRIETMIEHLNSLIADPRLSDMTDTLRDIAVTHYDWDLRADQMVKAYKKLLDV